jgi:hypothetical protein
MLLYSLKLMSSLFRQIFSEADVSTDFHNSLRSFLKNTGVWTVLRTYLDLPDWLLNTGNAPKTPQQRDADPPRGTDRRESSPAIHCGSTGHTAEAWLRSGGVSKASKFMNVFIDVLRLLVCRFFSLHLLDMVQQSLECFAYLTRSRLVAVSYAKRSRNHRTLWNSYRARERTMLTVIPRPRRNCAYGTWKTSRTLTPRARSSSIISCKRRSR